MEVLWLISQKVTHHEAARLAGVSRATAERYVAIYRSGGVAALRHFDWCKPVSALEQHRDTLEESFRKHPPHTVAEACAGGALALLARAAAALYCAVADWV